MIILWFNNYNLDMVKNFKALLIALIKYSTLLFLTSIIIVFAYRWINPTSSSVMFQNQVEGIINGEFNVYQVHWVSYDDVSKHIPVAMVAAEDQGFPNHFGFDFKQIEKALKDYERGRKLRGASTISQQTAKNLFLTNMKSFFRKGVEAYFTIMIELLWGKKRILEVYYNIAQFGENIFGVGNASLHFYKKSPEHLSVAESALLAAVLPNPKRFKVNHATGYVLGRKNWIIRQMNSLGGSNYLKDL